MGDKNLGTLKKQTVIIDGETLQRAVKNVSQYDVLTGYHEVGVVKAKGFLYIVYREGQSPYGEDYKNKVWTPSEEIEPARIERKASFLNKEEKAWLDTAVEYMLKEDYSPRQARVEYSGETYMTLDGVTPTALAENLFDNHGLASIERAVRHEAPEKLAQAFDYCSPASFSLANKASWVSQVTSSLKRLVSAGKAFTMYGEGERRREVRVYAHQDYRND